MRAWTSAGWLVVAAVLGVAQAVQSRASMNPDGIAYLDMGDAYLRGDWVGALRSHWSPLYAWLLGAAVRVVQPTPDVEFPLVHVVNLIVYCLALGTFTFLVLQAIPEDNGLPRWAALSIAFGVFVWCTLEYMPLGLVTPDLLLSALVYGACALLLYVRRVPSWRASAGFGALLGLGYLAKAPMLPLAFVFLIASARRVHMMAAGGAMAAVVVPFIIALSGAQGHPTLGDSAMLNYLWRIDQLPFVHWQGGPDAIGQPVHHSTLLLANPPVLSFESPFGVTYSPWYAPEYWFMGATPSFDWSRQLLAIGDALIVYNRMALDLRVPLAGLLMLLAIRPASIDRRGFALLAPALAAFAMYSLVLAEERYVAPFVVVCAVGLLSMVRLPKARWITVLTTLVSVLVVLSLLYQIGTTIATPLEPSPPDEQARVAMALREAGLRQGDLVASGNRGFNAYWARLARLSIVAEVSGYDGTTILESDSGARTAAQRILLAQPVRAVVAYGWPALTGDSAWRAIDGTSYFYYLKNSL